MASLPGLRLLSCSAAALALLIAACATDNGDPRDPPLAPLDEEPDWDDRDEEEPRPDFDPDFDDPDPDDPDAGAPGGDGGAPPTGDECIDEGDPGGSENLAKTLGATDDCDNDFKMVHGIANGAVDVDFYKLSVADKAGCLLQADFEMHTSDVELCVFVRCNNATANGGFQSCAQGTAATSGTLHGCCAAPGRAVPKWNCSGPNDSADFFFRVRQVNGEACLPYTFRYRF